MAAKKKPTIKVSKKKSKSGKGRAKKKEFFGLMDLPDELADRGREIWLAGLGALSMVEEEGVKLFTSLVEKGEKWEKEGQKQIGAAKDKLDATREKAASVMSDAAATGSKFMDLDDKIISTVEDTVEKVLQRLGVPTHGEVKDLAGKVEKLSSEVMALAMVIERGENGKAPKQKAKPAAKKVVYHVVPRAEGWAVKQEGVPEPLNVSTTKADALKAGRGLAKEKAPSRLVTHKKDGTVQESVTYEG